jgi:hypothetical protein
VSAWQELVTTALLGTDRRTPPGDLSRTDDPARAVLDAAAAFAARRHAGARPARAGAPDLAPRQTLDFAPDRAQRLLAHVLDARDTTLADVWLQHCVERGLGVRPRLWCALAVAAASPRGVDRALTAAALGARGQAFLALRPEWRVVLQPAPGRPAVADVVDDAVTDPLVLVGLPGPWSDEVAAVALRHVDDGELPLSQARRLATALALRAPLSFHDDVARMPFPDAVRAMTARTEIARSFDAPDQENP